MGLLLRFLFISICILYIVKLLRYFLIGLFGGVAGNTQQRGGQNYYQQQKRAFDDKVRIDHIPQAPKQRVPDSEGDFIDYEEVK